MKINIRTGATVALLVASFGGSAQTPRPHSFAGITALPDRTISLTLTGRVANTLQAYFDIYPIEVSGNLLTWKPLATLLRTNASTSSLTYSDAQAAASSARFYRTFTNQLATPLPKPTGPYAVGRVSRLVTDPSRTNRYNIKTNSSFILTIWYPAQRQPGLLPAMFDAPQLVSQWDDQAGQAGFAERVRSFVCHSYLDATIEKGSELFPVLIFSPGANSRANYHCDRFEDLASHGFIVLAIDHSAAGGVVLNGKVLYESAFDANNPTTATWVLNDRVRDCQFVLDELARLNGSDPVLTGRMNLDRIGAFGFSFGAGVAAEFCRIDARCTAVAVLEGYLQGAAQLRSAGVGKPVLGLYTPNGDKSLFNKASRDAVWLAIKNTEHADFSALFLVTEPNAGRREPPLIQRTYLISFFNKFLRDRDDHFMDASPAEFPRVTGFQTK